MVTWTGKNKSFVVVWSCDAQCYDVYKDGQHLVSRRMFSDVRLYLD